VWYSKKVSGEVAEAIGGGPMNPSRRRRSYGQLALVSDVAVLALAVAVVELLSPTASPTGEVPATPLPWLLTLCGLTLLLFHLRHMYTAPLRLELIELARLVIGATALAAVLTMAARVILTNQPYVAAETVRQWAATMPLLLAGRAAVLWSEARGRRARQVGLSTLIVGAGLVGRRTAARLLDEPRLGLIPVGFIDDDPLPAPDRAADLPVYAFDRFEEVAQTLQVDQVIIAFSNADDEQLLRLAHRCWQLGLSVSIVPRLFEIEGERGTLEYLGGLPLVALNPSDPLSWQFRAKYAFDRLVAGGLLILLLPLVALGALGTWLSLGRPILYRQLRVGRDRHVFDMLKFRTLRSADTGSEADAAWAAAQVGGTRVAAHAPLEGRTTRVSALMRRYSIDELPQLWNVVRGDMSLVGPRPERVTYVDHFETAVYRYRDRHRVKSGLTGWAQVSGLRGTTSLADRTEWDNHYIENWSPWLDLKILLRTLAAVVRDPASKNPMEMES
jgi:exopolysaccharide biosynthesis polyprenyl glycosylphosphotransferase